MKPPSKICRFEIGTHVLRRHWAGICCDQPELSRNPTLALAMVSNSYVAKNSEVRADGQVLFLKISALPWRQSRGRKMYSIRSRQVRHASYVGPAIASSTIVAARVGSELRSRPAGPSASSRALRSA